MNFGDGGSNSENNGDRYYRYCITILATDITTGIGMSPISMT